MVLVIDCSVSERPAKNGHQHPHSLRYQSLSDGVINRLGRQCMILGSFPASMYW